VRVDAEYSVAWCVVFVAAYWARETAGAGSAGDSTGMQIWTGGGQAHGITSDTGGVELGLRYGCIDEPRGPGLKGQLELRLTWCRHGC